MVCLAKLIIATSTVYPFSSGTDNENSPLASEVANFFILPSAFLRTIDAPANGVSGPFSRTIPDTLTCAIPTSAVKRNNVTHNRLLIELVIYEP